MSGSERFWEAVHDALDARRDPLDAPAVQQGLAEDPARLRQVAALRAALGTLERSRARRTALRALAALLLVATGLVGAALALREASDRAPAVRELVAAEATDARPVPPPRPDVAPVSRVLAFRAEVSLETPRERCTTTFDGTHTSVRTFALGPDGDRAGSASVLVAAASVVRSR